MMEDLFGLWDAGAQGLPERSRPMPDTLLLRGFLLPHEAALLQHLRAIVAAAPFRHMTTRSGLSMSVASTSCGGHGWVSAANGYGYAALDPLRGQPWPAMPSLFRTLATAAAAEAGFAGFDPDACLINRYQPGAKMGLHQDRDERDMTQPIVSFSLGLPARFQFGEGRRSGPVQQIPLFHGDVFVWGGDARLNFHGVLPVAEGKHARMGPQRISLTFRRAK